MKILVRILIGLVVVVALVAGAAYMILSGYDRGQLKQLAEEQAEAATGRKLTINGPLDFKLSLSPAITVEDVTFANAPWGTAANMASMKRFELEVAILPLLTGSLEINRLVLIEPEILVETNRSGKGNWELDTPKGEGSGDSGGDMQMQVNEIVIQDAAVTYRDGVTGETSLFTLDRLTGSAPSTERLSLNAKGNADGTPFSLNANLAQSGETYSIKNASITYGGTDLKGSGSLAMGGARPKITADFTSNVLDLTDVGGETEDAASSEAGTPGQYVFTEDPLPIGALRSVDADVNIAINTIKVTERAKITDAQMVLTLNNGDLNLSKLSGASMQGTVDMTARLNGAASPARLNTDVKVRNLNYGEALKALDVSESVDGNIDFTVKLNGAGNSMRRIASSLNGHTEMVATDGVITNKLLAVLSTGLDKVVAPLFGGKSKTDLRCAITRYDITNGLANTRVMVIDSSNFTLNGKGTVDLRTEKLKLKIDTKTQQSALLSLAVPFRVEGTLASPSAFPDPLGSVKGVASAAETIGGLFGTGDKDGDGKKKGGLGGLFGKVTGKDKKEETAATPSREQDACATALAAIGR